MRLSELTALGARASAADAGLDPGAVSLVFLMGCHDRRETTLRSLSGLMAQQHVDELLASVVLVDDGSSDGTADAVSRRFPMVRVVRGDGTLYWSRAMALAQQHALRHAAPDYLCWLNDDVTLRPDAVASLVAQSRRSGASAVVVGATTDGEGGPVTYSGYRRVGRVRPKDLARCSPTGSAQPVDTFNGNVVLVPRRVYEVVGGVDPSFEHSLGDIDYGYRVGRAGFASILAARPVGTCSRNALDGSWQDPSLSVRRRLQLLSSPKGMPGRSEAHFYRRHGTILWPAQALGARLAAVLSIVVSAPRHRHQEMSA